MAYDFEESSGQRVIFTPNASYSTYLAVSFWVYFESLSGSHQMHLVGQGEATNYFPRNFVVYYTPASGGQVGVSWIGAGPAFGEWTNNFSPTTGVWQHWYAEVDWTTNPDNPRLWIDGVSKSLTNTFGSNNQAPGTTGTQLSIGGEHGSADNNNNHDGGLAEIGIWNDNNSALRLNALSKGFSPLHFPKNLTEYTPFVRSLHNLKGGSGTLSSSAPVVMAHPRIIYPTPITMSTMATGGVAYSETLTEAVVLVDSAVRASGRTLTDVVTVVDSVIRNPGKVLSEVTTIVDTVLKTPSRTLSEAVTIVDSVLKTPGKVLSDVVTVVDSVLKTGGKMLTEAMFITDNGAALLFDGTQNYVTIGTLGNFLLNLGGSSAFVRLDVRTTATSGTIAPFGVLSNTDSTAFFVEINSGQTVNFFVRDKNGIVCNGFFTDSTIRNGSPHRIELTWTGNTITARLDGVAKTISYNTQNTPLSFTNPSHAFVIGARNNRGTIQEFWPGQVDNLQVGYTSSNLIASYTMDEGVGLTIADGTGNGNTGTLSGSPVPSWVYGLFSSTFFTKSTSRTLTDAVPIVDTLIRTGSRTLSEVITLVDSVLRSPGKVLSEVVAVVETTLKLPGKVLGESITLVDTFIRTTSRTFSETITLIDTFIRQLTIMRLLTEVVSIADELLTQKSVILTEIITIVESFIMKAKPWYRKLNTVFKSFLNTDWYTKNNTQWKDDC